MWRNIKILVGKEYTANYHPRGPAKLSPGFDQGCQMIPILELHPYASVN
jgi:hypothetical protein